MQNIFRTPKRPLFTFIDLFAGIGGFRIACQKNGGKCVFSSEWDINAQKTYYYNFGEELSAKICQEGGKALMSNPNSALGGWILRTILQKKEGELVTMEDLIRFGIDSVLIRKEHKQNSCGQEIYSISLTASDYESYSDFITEI